MAAMFSHPSKVIIIILREKRKSEKVSCSPRDTVKFSQIWLKKAKRQEAGYTPKSLEEYRIK